MAQPPKTSPGFKLSNIMAMVRGNFDIKPSPEAVKTLSFGSSELISTESRRKILGGAVTLLQEEVKKPVGLGTILSLTQSSLAKVGQERLENRKIIQLAPEVAKAARLMIASTFSPNDLARSSIAVVFDDDSIQDSYKTRLNDFATDFFERKLKLMTEAPKWVYRFGYEAGAEVFAIIPMRSFEAIHERSYIGTENYIDQVVKPLAHESLLGFGDGPPLATQLDKEVQGLESLADTFIQDWIKEDQTRPTVIPPGLGKGLAALMIGQESLNLTDNPSLLEMPAIAKEKRKGAVSKKINQVYKRPLAETIVAVDAKRGPLKKDRPLGNPMLMRLPPESVTVIHTPGDPQDHQGYLILLDQSGNPINSVEHEEAKQGKGTNYNTNQGNLFNQIYNAYGLTQGFHAMMETETMGRLYTKIVSQHLNQRLDSAGFSNVDIGNLDGVMRSLFTRFLQEKQTRVLFLPKDLVTYMAYELDHNGYGISRLDGIKFNLGMKMAVQISRIMAAVKGAMDRRNITIKFNDNMMEQPEQVIQSIVQQYLAKSTLSFSVDPTLIQSQIADKSLSIKTQDAPGLDQFELTNDPDQRSSSFDFDTGITEYLDQQTMNGMRVPPAAMNALGENEYSRSVATTNLFFAQDVSIDQDAVVSHVSDLCRKYARYSEEFAAGIQKIVPAEVEETESGEESGVLEDNTDAKAKPKKLDQAGLDRLIDSMSISLPRPNVAPSEAQFEILTKMIEAFTNMINTLYPDDLIGPDDEARSAVGLLRARLIAVNVRAYIESAGMTDLVIPDANIAGEMANISEMQQSLRNLAAMVKAKTKYQRSPDDPLPGGEFGTDGSPAPMSGEFSAPSGEETSGEGESDEEPSGEPSEPSEDKTDENGSDTSNNPSDFTYFKE